MRIVSALAALMVLYAPMAHAQPAPERHQDTHHATKPAPQPSRKPVAKPAPRPHAKLSHAQRCKARYASYNPRTDRYTIKPGVTRRCAL